MADNGTTVGAADMGECSGWQWCGWCEGQSGGCEFCDGAGKRGCPHVVGDISGRQWEHTDAGEGVTCGECGSTVDAGTPMFRRTDNGATAHRECVSPAYGAAPVI